MTNEPIDWTRPICLNTVPPRKARLVLDDGGAIVPMFVEADWRGDGKVYCLWLSRGGLWGVHGVRNVRPGDFEPAEPAPALAAELAEALRDLLDVLPDRYDYPDICEPADRAAAALAKWEARK